MNLLINILILLIAAMHIFYMYLEVFAWEKLGPGIFKGYPRSFFSETKVMAINQGTYNGFIAAGLIWSVLIHQEGWGDHLALFFLICVLIAGIVGAKTADKKIFMLQGIPALITIALILLKYYSVK